MNPTPQKFSLEALHGKTTVPVKYCVPAKWRAASVYLSPEQWALLNNVVADATAAAEAEAKACRDLLNIVADAPLRLEQALAHIRKLETNDRENHAAFERVRARVRELEGEVERLRGERRVSDPARLQAAKEFAERVRKLSGTTGVAIVDHVGWLIAEIDRLADAGGE